MHTFADGLRGIMALEDIEAGETIMKIPLEHCFVKHGDDNGSWPVNLALSILQEMEKGRESKWFPYLATLPSPQQLLELLPLHWDPVDIDQGFGSTDGVFEDDVNYAIENAWAWRDAAWNDYQYAPREAADKFLRADFEYGLDIVQTRNCCPIPTMHLVVPFLDLLNHDNAAQTVLSVEHDHVLLRSNIPIKKSQQVFLNYHIESQLLSPATSASDKGTYPLDVMAHCFTSYGFVLPCTETGVQLPLTLVRKALLDANDATIPLGTALISQGCRPGSSMAILQSCGLQVTQPFTVSSGGASMSLIAVLRVLTADPSRREAWSKLDATQLQKELFAVPAAGLEQEAKSALIGILTEEYDRHLACAKKGPKGPPESDCFKPAQALKQYSADAANLLTQTIDWAAGL